MVFPQHSGPGPRGERECGLSPNTPDPAHTERGSGGLWSLLTGLYRPGGGRAGRVGLISVGKYLTDPVWERGRVVTPLQVFTVQVGVGLAESHLESISE